MILKYITLSSGFCFLIFSFVLLLKKTPIKRINSILGCIFIAMTLYSFNLFFLQHANILKSNFLLRLYVPIDYILAMVFAPGIYFYLQETLNRRVSFKKITTWMHALPALPSIIFVVYFITLPSNVRIEKAVSGFNSTIWQGNLLNLVFYVQMIIYLFVCYFQLKKQLKISHKILFRNVNIDVSWLKTYFTIDLVIMFVTAPLCFYVANDYFNTIIGQVAIDVQFIYIFVQAAWKHGIFPVEPLVVPLVQPEIVQTNNEPGLKIADSRAEEYFERLKAFMDSEKIYLQPGCTIQLVAEQAKIPLHHLSHILNNRLNKNFFDFINEHRINDAKILLSDPNNNKLTIEAIGFECGFGSKTTFNKAFKKHTNQTPSEFRNSSLMKSE
jgi:AraC-like DNA-binding protein